MVNMYRESTKTPNWCSEGFTVYILPKMSYDRIQEAKVVKRTDTQVTVEVAYHTKHVTTRRLVFRVDKNDENKLIEIKSKDNPYPGVNKWDRATLIPQSEGQRLIGRKTMENAIDKRRMEIMAETKRYSDRYKWNTAEETHELIDKLNQFIRDLAELEKELKQYVK